MKTQRLEQGSNISSGCPGPRGPGTTHNKIDQGRSLTLRAPQGCLRVWVRRIQPTVREQVNLHRRLGSYPAYLSTPRRPSSHPRGFRLIHLSKSFVVKVLRRLPLKVRQRSTFSRVGPAGRCPAATGRRNLIVRSALVNRPPRRFLSNPREAHIDSQRAFRHRVGSTVIRRRKPTGSPLRSYFSKGVAGSNRRPGATNAAVQAPRPLPGRWQE